MITALIVAAGQGRRMGSTLPKQYLALGGRPILTHTLQAFDACALVERIVLVVPGNEMDFCCREILTAADLRAMPLLVAGGARRQESVFNGLAAIPENEGIVLIHDGVRPLVSGALIRACIHGAQRWDACIPVLAVTDTLKRVDAGGRIQDTLARDSLRLAQTPQAFRLSLIKEAHRLGRQEGVQATDDAALVERMGVAVHTVAGEIANIKITAPMDLRRAEAYLGCEPATGPVD